MPGIQGGRQGGKHRGTGAVVPRPGGPGINVVPVIGSVREGKNGGVKGSGVVVTTGPRRVRTALPDENRMVPRRDGGFGIPIGGGVGPISLMTVNVHVIGKPIPRTGKGIGINRSQIICPIQTTDENNVIGSGPPDRVDESLVAGGRKSLGRGAAGLPNGPGNALGFVIKSEEDRGIVGVPGRDIGPKSHGVRVRHILLAGGGCPAGSAGGGGGAGRPGPVEIQNNVGVIGRAIIDHIVDDGLIGSRAGSLTAEPPVLVQGKADDIGLISSDGGCHRGLDGALARIAPFQARDIDTPKAGHASPAGLKLVARDHQAGRRREGF